MFTLLLLYILLLFIIFLFQRKLIYFPETYSRDRQPHLISQFHLKPWPDNENYRGYISLNAITQSKGTILIFHGNAGSAKDRFFYIDALERFGYRVILIEYPGYGARTGHPSESVFIADGLQTALLAQKSFDGPFFLWGESLGAGAVSGIINTGQIKVKGIILMTPFDNLSNIAQHHYWFFLGKWIIRDKFNNIANLQNYSGNTAVILAEKDEIIPKQNTMRLYKSISGDKQIWKFAESGHNSVPVYPEAQWWSQVMAFVDNDQE